MKTAQTTNLSIRHDVVCGVFRSVQRTLWCHWKEVEWIRSVVGGHVVSTPLILAEMGN